MFAAMSPIDGQTDRMPKINTTLIDRGKKKEKIELYEKFITS
jgi:hypothetical protein